MNLHICKSIVLAIIALWSCGNNTNSKDLQETKEQDYFRLYLTDVEREDLKGKVKSVIDTTYNVTLRFGEIVKVSVKESHCMTFDEKGRVLNDGSYDYAYVESDSTIIKEAYSNGKKINHAISYYNAEGKLIKEELFNKENKLVYLFTYTYTHNKLLKDYTVYGEDGKIVIKRYDMQYDLNNCLTHYKLGRGETLKWGTYTDIAYDANQHIISEKTYEYNSQETVLHKDNGNLTKSIDSNVDLETGKLFSRTNKEYTTYLGEVVVKNEECLMFKYEGDWYEKKIINHGVLTHTRSSTQKQELTYDAHDNFIKSVIYIDEIPVEMTVRHIEYYK